MDGFFVRLADRCQALTQQVSKFHIGKRSKKVPEADESEPEDVLETVDVAVDGTVTVSEPVKDSGPAFDDAADAEIIAASRRSHLKRKGHDPRSLKPRPAKAPRTAA